MSRGEEKQACGESKKLFKRPSAELITGKEPFQKAYVILSKLLSFVLLMQ